MLNIYTNRELVSNDKYVLDNDAYFVYTGIKDTEAVRDILSKIDGATIKDNRLFDRFGVSIYPDMLSTGSKTLINMSLSDKVFDGRELGYNALVYMFSAIDGNVYFEDKSVLQLIEDVSPGRYSLNGEIIDSEEELDSLCL